MEKSPGEFWLTRTMNEPTTSSMSIFTACWRDTPSWNQLSNATNQMEMNENGNKKMLSEKALERDWTIVNSGKEKGRKCHTSHKTAALPNHLWKIEQKKQCLSPSPNTQHELLAQNQTDLGFMLWKWNSQVCYREWKTKTYDLHSQVQGLRVHLYFR